MQALCSFVLVVLAACGGAPNSPGVPSTGVSSATLAAGATPAEPAALQDMLPAEFDGVAAHTFAVGPDLLQRLAALAGVSAEDVEAAYASEHGERFVQTYAIRVPGRSPAELLALLPQAAYATEDPGSLSITEEALGGRSVTVVQDPASADRIGTFYALATESALIVVQAIEQDVAEATIAGLP